MSIWSDVENWNSGKAETADMIAEKDMVEYSFCRNWFITEKVTGGSKTYGMQVSGIPYITE